MKRSTRRAVVVILVLFATVSAVRAAISSGATRQAANSHPIAITRSGTQPSSQGSAQYFTGTARIQPLFDAHEPSRANGVSVTFEPGARTAWHTHPLGQTLIVTAGSGRVARWGEPAQQIAPGDVVWIPPGQKHWHGASPTTGLTHIAIHEHVGGKNVDWLEHVTDEQYGR
jgi:quercetin dioxygenase-like cupin family protein